MSTNLPAVSRPTTVTIAVVLAWIQAILLIIFGVLFFLARNEVVIEGTTSSTRGGVAVFLGIVLIILGIITALVARGLSNGNNFSRMFVTVLQVLALISALWGMTQGQRGQLGSALLAVLILALLWNGAANQFFASRR